MLGLTGGFLALTAIIQLISNRINCRSDGDCAHAPCDTDKRRARMVFFTATLLYVASVGQFAFAH